MNSNRILLSFLVFAFLIAGCGKKKVVDYGPQNTQIISTNAPEPSQESRPLSMGLDASLSRVENWHPAVDRELRRLESFVTSVISKSDEPSDFIAPKLNYFGLDRETAAKTFTGNRIQVSRWRAGQTAPTVAKNGLDSLIGNLFEPWIASSSFRTQFQAHRISKKDGELIIQATAKTRGRIRENLGLEGTTMISTKFRVVSEQADEIELTELKVTAHEEVKFAFRGGQLFHEATSSLLKLDENSTSQLGHSVDEWAEWIPGIDIMGNQGIAIGDSNNDGLEDIYVCQPHGLPNLLLRQNPDGTAEDVAHLTNANLLDESRAALFVDLDNDGDEDLVVSTRGELILMSNSGQGEFQLEHRLLAGFDGGSLSAADYDNDGDLDLYVCKYHSILNDNDLFAAPNSYSNASNGGRNVLLRNNEGWSFEDVTEKVGLKSENEKFSSCAVWSDYDLDGDQDLYVVNEFSPDVLYENKSGWFGALNLTEQSLDDSTSGRSASVGDFNGDGRPDFFVAANVLPEATRIVQQEELVKDGLAESFLSSRSRESRALYSTQKTEGQFFTGYRLPSPIFNSNSAFASVNLDYNNDGIEDLILTNGVLSRSNQASDCTSETNWIQQIYSDEVFREGNTVTDLERWQMVTRTLSEQILQGDSFGENQRNVCLLGMGQLGFANFSGASGIDLPEDGRGVATVDWDHDGDLDVVTSSRTSPQLRFFVNRLETENQYVAFQLKGLESNRNAVGARVEVYLKRRSAPLIKTVMAGSGAYSQSSKILHFGVPKNSTIEKVLVHWPSSLVQTFAGVGTGARYIVEEGVAEPAEVSNIRFDVELLDGGVEEESQSLEFSRSVFYPPMALPSMDFQSDRQAWIPLRNIDRMPILAVFVDDSPATKDVLKSLAREAKEISKANVDVVAIGLDSEQPNSVEHFEKMQQLINESEFPFRFGAASESMQKKIELLYGEWYSKQEIPQTPFAWLMDKDGFVRIFYPPGSVRADQALKDLVLISGGLSNTAKRASPRKGVWVGSTPSANYSRIARRFKDLNFTKDETRFAELSRPFLANQICRSAIELRAEGDLIAARAEFASALEFDPQCELACVEFGNFLIAQSGTEQDEVVRISLLNEAQVLFEKAIQLEPSNTQAILGRADVARNRNQIPEAIKQLENYLEINPDRAEVHAIIGRLHFHNEKYVQATSHLLKAFNKRPTLPFVAGDLGFLYMNGGLYEEARSFLKVANQLQPSAVDLKRHLAQAEFLTGNYESSIEMLREVILLQPNEKLPKSLLAWLLATCPFESLRDGQEGLELASTLVKIYSSQASSHEICAAAHAEVGDFDNAMLLQQKAVDLVEDGTTTEAYSEKQIEGLKSRMESYKRKRAYRMDGFEVIPIRQPGT
jgi:tetratricopeptide (TPR) repeat protein